MARHDESLNAKQEVLCRYGTQRFSHAPSWRSYMRRVALVLLLLATVAAVSAQYPQQAPTFAPGDSEGLVVSPNPRIRYAWKRKVFWKVSPEPGRGTFTLIPVQTTAERAQMNATLDMLTALLKATPNGTNGEGFWVMDARMLDYFDPFVLPRADAPRQLSAHLRQRLLPVLPLRRRDQRHVATEREGRDRVGLLLLQSPSRAAGRIGAAY